MFEHPLIHLQHKHLVSYCCMMVHLHWVGQRAVDNSQYVDVLVDPIEEETKRR